MPFRRTLPLVVSLVACAQSPAGGHGPLPGVPISGEPHHHLVFSNPFVRAWEVEVPAGQATLMHKHLNDYLYVVLGDAQISNEVAGKPPARSRVVDTQVNFAHGPFAHIARDEGSEPFRNITIELLHKQGAVKILYPSVAAALQAKPQEAAKGVAVIDSGEMAALAYALPDGAELPPSPHQRMVVFPERQRREGGAREPNAPMFPVGVYEWLPAGKGLAVKAEGTGPEPLLVLEFKDSAK